MQEYGYNLQRDGWLNVFTDEKSQAMRNNGIPWRGAREKHHVFFSILLSILTDKNDVIIEYQCGVGTIFFQHHLYFEFSVIFVSLVSILFTSLCFRWFDCSMSLP